MAVRVRTVAAGRRRVWLQGVLLQTMSVYLSKGSVTRGGQVGECHLAPVGDLGVVGEARPFEAVRRLFCGSRAGKGAQGGR